MKKYFRTTVFVALLAVVLPLSLNAGTRVYVKVKPPVRKVVVVKPAKPFKNAVWISGRWHRNGKAWTWKSGHWVKPRRNAVWVPGHWAHNRHGWFWIEGHWKRK